MGVHERQDGGGSIHAVGAAGHHVGPRGHSIQLHAGALILASCRAPATLSFAAEMAPRRHCGGGHRH